MTTRPQFFYLFIYLVIIFLFARYLMGVKKLNLDNRTRLAALCCMWRVRQIPAIFTCTHALLLQKMLLFMHKSILIIL